MKIVIAPDSFKESLSAVEAAAAIEKGFKVVYPNAEYIKVPMADGGEGLVESLVHAVNGSVVKKEVTGPLGEKVDGFFGVIHNGKTAVIEMAAAAGLHLVPRKARNPLMTTTYGVGELILAALEYGVEHIIMGLGGSATNDGGAGMAQALGANLLDEKGQEIGYGGGELGKLHTINLDNLDPRLKDIVFEVACDVDNPLVGKRGASAIFGPQKGATTEMIGQLDQNLLHYARMIESKLGKKIVQIPGSGAAGGLGAGLLAFLPCELKKGIDIVIQATGLEEIMEGASLVITGEGKIDDQTIFGKTPIGVARTAKKYHIPVIGLAGTLSHGYESVYEHGIDAVFSIVPGVASLEVALENAYINLQNTARNIAAIYRLS